ncbi:MAG: rod shape-determining protein MreC [Bacteroidales bacterium]|jgi:rod shape-determining protein MreC|nr:rod shape-determining protein MreC [Bacteroidales bacterium]MDD3872092.1 rod shape-determining protein MreC [Bacteroidales bacterium]
MQNLLRFIIRYSFQIVFIILEIIALTLVFNRNPLPHARFFQLVQGANGFIYHQVSKATSFFNLKGENAILATENARLRHELSNRNEAVRLNDSIATLSNPVVRYDYIPAVVVNNSVHKQNNYLTINVGSRHGVRPDMGVVGPSGIVGVVRNVSANYSTVLSVLNSKFRASVKIQDESFFGTLIWDGLSFRDALLTEVPGYARVFEGRPVVTSGFSSIYPAGEPVGTVISVELNPAGSFYEIRVRLSEDFKKLTRVYVIRDFSREEIQTLEEQTYD